MFKHFSRTAIALTLIINLWAGAVVAAGAQQPQQQPIEKSETPPPAAQKESANGKAAPKPAAAEAKSSSGSPLSVNEDPRMIGKRNINKGFVLFKGGSLEKEVALGRQLAAEVDRQAKFVDDPLITEYVNRVGQNVVLHSDAKIPFTIKVIDSDEANAFALPGGFFYVNKGLVLMAENEAELAGVMAHEIAHVTARHAMENMRKGQWLEAGAIVGSIFTGGITGMIYQNLAGFGLMAAFLKFTRGAEEEADRLGVQYLYAAGYDPGAMSTMFEKLSAKNKKKPGFIAKAFSTHPQSVDRMEASRALVARFPEQEEYVLSTSEFQRVKARLLRLSNARASTVGDLAGSSDGDGGDRRPTLKRRQPAPDGSTTTTTTTTSSGDQQPSEQNQSGPPRLRRRPTDQQTPPAQQPDDIP